MNQKIIDDLKALVEGESAYAMDMKFSGLFAKLTGRPETSVLINVRELYSELLSKKSGRGKWESATREACGLILDWYLKASEQPTDDMISLVENHSRQYVWAVLLGKQRFQWTGKRIRTKVADANDVDGRGMVQIPIGWSATVGDSNGGDPPHYAVLWDHDPDYSEASGNMGWCLWTAEELERDAELIEGGI